MIKYMIASKTKNDDEVYYTSIGLKIDESGNYRQYPQFISLKNKNKSPKLYDTLEELQNRQNELIFKYNFNSLLDTYPVVAELDDYSRIISIEPVYPTVEYLKTTIKYNTNIPTISTIKAVNNTDYFRKYILGEEYMNKKSPSSINFFTNNNQEKGNKKLKGKKIFKNKNVTILKQYDDRKQEINKWISKNTDDHYDLEKGVMMALLLSEGYKYKDIRQLIERSKDIKG